jgi:hypothetical protein
MKGRMRDLALGNSSEDSQAENSAKKDIVRIRLTRAGSIQVQDEELNINYDGDCSPPNERRSRVYLNSPFS